MTMIKYGSVCSGVEAATVAWHSLGWRPQWFSEIEKFPSADNPPGDRVVSLLPGAFCCARGGPAGRGRGAGGSEVLPVIGRSAG